MFDGRVTTGVFSYFFSFFSPLSTISPFTSCGYDDVWQAGLHEGETTGDAAPFFDDDDVVVCVLTERAVG